MALDARVYCNCLELQVLRTQPPEWQVYVSEEGGGGTKATGLETQMAFDRWNSPSATPFPGGCLLDQSLLRSQVLHLWLDTYQTGKDFTRRGIVEVVVA